MGQLTEHQKQRMIEAWRAVLNMSHGIKNTLQAIGSGRDVMNEALGRSDIDMAKRTWNILRQNLERIEKLSLDMLKYSKDEALNLKPCDFNHLVESAVKTIRPQANQLQVEIIVQTDEKLQPVSMDAEKMRDVIMNLLVNAIEATEPKTGEVIVRTELDRDNQRVVLRVSDNGRGIGNTDQIFEPFYSTKDNVGAGLGLTIAHKIVEKHGGTLSAQSLPDEGATFTVCIPMNAEKTA
ncbi:MAG: sensor histidine kinase [Anaerohalosphaeraceae bacterium]